MLEMLKLLLVAASIARFPAQVILLPLRLTVPSSTLSPATVCVAARVTVKAPVASEPAEKIAMSPLAQVVPVLEPVESVDQLEVTPVSQFPLGAAPPEPGVPPSVSQYLGDPRVYAVALPKALSAAAATSARLRPLKREKIP